MKIINNEFYYTPEEILEDRTYQFTVRISEIIFSYFEDTKNLYQIYYWSEPYYKNVTNTLDPAIYNRIMNEIYY